MVPPTGPTCMTWHHGGTCWSHVVDVVSWSHKVGLQLGVAWSCQWAPHMWPCRAKSARRSSPSDFYFIWQKNLLYGSLDPATYCCVTTRPLTNLCCSLVCFFICLVIKANSLFYFPKKLKKPSPRGFEPTTYWFRGCYLYHQTNQAFMYL